MGESATQHEPAAAVRGRAWGAHFLHVARFELVRHLRRRRLVVLLFLVALMIGLVFVILQVFGRSGDVYGYASTYGTWVTILAALAATFFGSDALVGEFEQRTGYLLFPQPVTRTAVFLGKALTAIALTTFTLALYYGIVAIATGIVKGGVPIELAYSLLLAILYATAALGVAFFLSSALRTMTMSSVLTFATLFFVLSIVTFVLAAADVRADGNLAFAGNTITNMLSGPYPEQYPGDMEVPGPGGNPVTIYSPQVLTSVVVMAIWALVGFGLALVLYRRREMKG